MNPQDEDRLRHLQSVHNTMFWQPDSAASAAVQANVVQEIREIMATNLPYFEQLKTTHHQVPSDQLIPGQRYFIECIYDRYAEIFVGTFLQYAIRAELDMKKEPTVPSCTLPLPQYLWFLSKVDYVDFDTKSHIEIVK